MKPIDSLLLQATRRGIVHWAFLKDVILPGSSVAAFRYAHLIGHPLVCEWEDRAFRLYEFREKYATDEDRWEWMTGVALELVEEAAGPAQALLSTESSGIELLYLARNQAADVKGVALSLSKALEDALNEDAKIVKPKKK